MAVKERDPHTGYLTTGHEWNGIKELNTPVPRLVYWSLIATALFSVAYWVLMPTWPIGTTYTKGWLGIDQRTTVMEELREAVRERSVWASRIENEGFAEIQADQGLMEIVRRTGRTLFGDNCGACHGVNAQGVNGAPSLTTSSWLWGGDAETIAETIRVGINSAHPDARMSQMPAFGRDKMLSRSDIESVVGYVRTLSAASEETDAARDNREAGQVLFAANCASCHGDDGKGKTEMGAPNLTDPSWIYGGDFHSVYTTVWGGRQGHMPTWEARLSLLDRKILTLYLIDLRRESP